MKMEESSDIHDNSSVKSRKGLFIFAIFICIVPFIIDAFVDNELFSRVMFYLQQRKLPPFEEIKPYQLLLTTLFAFGVPIGMMIAFIFAIRRNEKKSSHIRRFTITSFLLLLLVGITPALLGREMTIGLFGVTGFIILTSVMVTYWFISRYRFTLKKDSQLALDYKLLGYLCFGIVTWQVCGFATSPGYAIFPEKMIDLGVRPFAIGQLKSITMYFTLGWVFTAVGFYKNYKLSLREE